MFWKSFISCKFAYEILPLNSNEITMSDFILLAISVLVLIGLHLPDKFSGKET